MSPYEYRAQRSRGSLACLWTLRCSQVRVDGPDGAHKHEAVEIKGWVSSIHKYVAHVITATYQVIDVKTASTMLGGLAGAELAAFAAEQGWQVSTCIARVGVNVVTARAATAHASCALYAASFTSNTAWASPRSVLICLVRHHTRLPLLARNLNRDCFFVHAATCVLCSTPCRVPS